MKSKNIICRLWFFTLGTGMVSFFLASCTKNYAEYNTNPYNATREQMEADGYLIGRNFPIMINAVIPAADAGAGTTFVNSYQVAFNLAADCYSGYMGQANNWNGNTNNLTYGFNLQWVNEQFSLSGRLMNAWKQVEEATALSGDSLQFSVAQLIKITGMIRMTDSYGPVPYSQIPTGTFTPAYDSQESLYRTFIKELGEAADVLHKKGASAGKTLAPYDQIYAGDYMQWAKYANSLKLRLAIRMVYVDPANARLLAEEAVRHPAGLLDIVADGALQKPAAGLNFKNPLRTLTQDYNEARMGASMDSYLRGYKDPRIASFFLPSVIRPDEYVGVRTGINVVPALYQPFSRLNVSDDTGIPWMRASEVYFLRAEGALRGWNMNGNAQQLYEAGVQLSFAELGVNMPTGYLNDEILRPADYTDYTSGGAYSRTSMGGVSIRWRNSDTFQVNLERIITQKWIATYPNGQEAWTEFRRTGYPRLFPVALNRSGGTVDQAVQVRRLPYPLQQYQENGAQVEQAISLLGGPDNGGTRLWWDARPL
ncbi:SusD/RagB family nutrient-binding outer membrane lipoprotein [Sphingobacterium paludis]|uniref:SusD/RagB-like outer membrane lipoprotein n=1 Tax=Sphingobacterium paludis TaxID=1476465 RepID=A0A4R7CR98_9SPHI|nr:SusD/RagB family nutrient-binding outer membrane lipoprotein [Sphingobacterium paludis]TDS08898.1 SusD/RagB-like outer membrane lipoprotein [Sphingobacterium paludis]